jgi:hypothetical protein
VVQVGFHLMNHEKKKGSQGERGGHGLAEDRKTSYNVCGRYYLKKVGLCTFILAAAALGFHHAGSHNT